MTSSLPLMSQKNAQSAASKKYFFKRPGRMLKITRQTGRNTTRYAAEKKEVRALPLPASSKEESAISVSLLQAHAPACCSFYIPHDLAQSIRGALLRAMRLFCRPCRRKGYDRHGPDGRFLRGRHAVCTIFDCPSSYACHLLCSPDGVFCSAANIIARKVYGGILISLNSWDVRAVA